MKLKYLLAACTAFFLVSCSNDDELSQPPQHGDIVGLNIKDAKYIYTSGTNTRSSSAQYRQIKKDGRDMELSWIDNIFVWRETGVQRRNGTSGTCGM